MLFLLLAALLSIQSVCKATTKADKHGIIEEVDYMNSVAAEEYFEKGELPDSFKSFISDLVKHPDQITAEPVKGNSYFDKYSLCSFSYHYLDLLSKKLKPLKDQLADAYIKESCENNESDEYKTDEEVANKERLTTEEFKQVQAAKEYRSEFIKSKLTQFGLDKYANNLPEILADRRNFEDNKSLRKSLFICILIIKLSNEEDHEKDLDAIKTLLKDICENEDTKSKFLKNTSLALLELLEPKVLNFVKNIINRDDASNEEFDTRALSEEIRGFFGNAPDCKKTLIECIEDEDRKIN